jgi:hypothetical protein
MILQKGVQCSQFKSKKCLLEKGQISCIMKEVISISIYIFVFVSFPFMLKIHALKFLISLEGKSGLLAGIPKGVPIPFMFDLTSMIPIWN